MHLYSEGIFDSFANHPSSLPQSRSTSSMIWSMPPLVSVCMCIHTAIHPSIQAAIQLSIHPAVNSSIQPSNHLTN